MSAIAFAIPGDIDLPTGGYAYDRRLLAEWRAMGIAATHVALPGSFPFPTQGDLAQTGHAILSQPWDDTLLIDGLAYGAFPESVAAGLAGRVVALVHHPLGLETGLAPDIAQRLISREAAALRHARDIVTTSPAMKRLLVADFGVDAARITLARRAWTRRHAPQAASAAGRCSFWRVGSIVPRKGYHVLVEALATLRDRSWRLTIVGAGDRAPDTMADLTAQIAEAGLEDRILLAGAVDDTMLNEAYDRADLFVMPSLFEGYGNGVDRSTGTRPAYRLHHGRRGRRDRARRNRVESPARRCRRACQGHGKPD